MRWTVIGKDVAERAASLENDTNADICIIVVWSMYYHTLDSGALQKCWKWNLISFSSFVRLARWDGIIPPICVWVVQAAYGNFDFQ